MRALDLFCGGGGAGLGILHAGFDEIVGIDIREPSFYPGTFIQADIRELPVDPMDFDIKCVIVYLTRDIPAFVMYYVYGASR